jgi:hypothetical protein
LNGSGAPVPTVLAAVVSNDDGGHSALFTTVWPDAPPALGTNIDLAVTVQEKQDVLLVPRRAVRSVGAQQYVEYMDGAARRRADVQVGIRSANEVEITQGIREGQMVLTGP